MTTPSHPYPARRARRARGRPLPLVVVLLVVLALVSAACSKTQAAPPATTEPPATEAPTTTTEVPDDAGTRVYKYEPKVGDCFDQRSEDDEKNKKKVPYYLLVDCGLPHQSEVFAVMPYRDPATPDLRNAPFPGDEALRDFGKRECPKLFADYVGLEFERSTWVMNYVVPLPEDWPRNTTVACTLQPPVEKRAAGTARGSNR